MSHLSQLFYVKSSAICKTAFGLLSVLLFFTAGCSGKSTAARPMEQPLHVESAEGFRPGQVGAIAIMPLASGVAAGVDEAALERLTGSLIRAFETGTSISLVNTSSPADTGRALQQVSQLRQAERKKAVAFGKALAVDNVLFGIVDRFEQSSGGRFGSNEPANVSFKLWLLDVGRNKVLWSAAFQKHEQPLSENLFRIGEQFRSGVGYSNSVEIVESAFVQAAAELEKRRLRQEQ